MQSVNSESCDQLAQYIKVAAKAVYLPQHSQPEHNQFTFAYTINIHNLGPHRVQLLSRHWIITDARNYIEEVEGDGVVGKQPVIAPNKVFRYHSGATLNTTTGCMEGSYTMTTLFNEMPQQTFAVPIPAFALFQPKALH